MDEQRPFIKYVDIERMGNPENDGMLKNSDDDIVIEEKVDGGNGCFWVDDKKLRFSTRNNEILDEKTFSKQTAWLLSNVKIDEVDTNLFYYVEWMQKHTINYGVNIPMVVGLDIKPREGAFGRSPLFIGAKAKKDLFDKVGVPVVHLWGVHKARDVNDELINGYMVKSNYYDGKPEGVCLKNYNRMNMYGRQMFAKVVSDEFKEQNRAVFGGIKKDNSDTIKLCDEFVTQARIRKKILYLTMQESLQLDRKLMHKLPIMVCEDVLKEEYATIIKNYKEVNIGSMKQIVAKKCLNEIDWMIVERQNMNSTYSGVNI